MQINFHVENLTGKPTIYSALRDKLGREPTSAELKTDVMRILAEARLEVNRAASR